MKSVLPWILVAGVLVAVSGCGDPPPQEVFGQAVLSVNLIYGFAGSGMEREMASPSVKLTDAATGATAPMTRAEMLQQKVSTVEDNFEKVRALSSTAETKDMLAASIALYEFVLPVYRQEYAELARLYDGGAAPEKISALEKSIRDGYAARFQELHGVLLSAGKAHAARNHIAVREVSPEPSR